MKKAKLIIAVSGLLLASASVLKMSEWIEPVFSYSELDYKTHSGNLTFARLSKTLYHVQEQYVDPDRVNPKTMLKKALNHFSLSVPEIKVDFPSESVGIFMVGDHKKEIDLNVRNVFALKATLVDTIKFVLQNKSSIRADELESLAINATLSTLDPHSQFLSKEHFEETRVGTSGQFGGLGIVIGIRESKLTIISPLDGTPAFKAGLKAGDHIAKIGDEPTEGILLEEAVDKMRGTKGTKVSLSVMRKNWTEPKDYTLTRDIIKIVSIESELLKQKIGYLKIKTFQEDTTTSLQTHLKKLHDRAGGKISGLIVDLRNNPGGLLDQAIGVSDVFLDRGVIVSTVGPRNRLFEEDRADSKTKEPNYPIIILTNLGSASASEIVAGALQKHERAIVVGDRQTFGKSTVQQLFQLPSDSGLKLTIAKYLTAGTDSIQNTGIISQVRTIPKVVKKDLFDIVENSSTFREDQLDGHFSQESKEPIKKPDYEVSYLMNAEEDATNEYLGLSSSDSPQKRAEKLLTDFDIRFSTKALEEVKDPAPAALLKAVAKILPAVEAEESEKTKLALLKEKIDWSSPTVKSGPCKEPLLTFDYQRNQKPVEVLTAGEKFTLNVQVENVTDCTFHQLKAVTQSKIYFLTDQEFLFGKLLPKQKLSRSINIELPKSSVDSILPIEITLSDTGTFKEKKIASYVRVQSIAAPIFAFGYQTTGTIAAGKEFDIVLNVKNVGKSTSEKGTVALKPEEGVLAKIQRARIPITNLKPGEEKSFPFHVTISPDFNLEKIYFNLEISDYSYRTYLTSKMNLPLSAKSIQEKLNVPPVLAVTNEAELLQTSLALPLKLKGSIQDDTGVKDMYILVNQTKVLYQTFEANPTKAAPYYFEKDISLEPGENQIIVVARDQADLYSRKSYLVYRPEVKKP